MAVLIRGVGLMWFMVLRVKYVWASGFRALRFSDLGVTWFRVFRRLLLS